MKKIFAILTVALGIICATSCSIKTKGIYFTPSELTVEVGQTKTVTFEAYSETAGYGLFDLQYNHDNFIVEEGSGDGELKITGVSASTSDLVMTCSTESGLTGTLRVVVTAAE